MGQNLRIVFEPRLHSKYVEVNMNPSWKEIFAGLDAANIPADFLSPEERDQGPPQEREDLWDTDDPPSATSVE
jgi:hypothetical protein